MNQALHAGFIPGRGWSGPRWGGPGAAQANCRQRRILCAARGPVGDCAGLVSRHRSSVGLRWPSKRIAALHRLPSR